MGNVVPLPTASAQRVRQPAYKARAMREALNAGTLARFPIERWAPPAMRAWQHEQDARRETLERAGIYGGLAVLAGAMIATLSPSQREAFRARLELIANLDPANPSPACEGALVFASPLLDLVEAEA